MDIHDGAEVRELLGIFILSHLTKLINQLVIGLYRDDGLIVVKNLNGQQRDKLRKSVSQVFESFGFKIKSKTNLTEVSFLEVTFTLIKETLRPYRKSNLNHSQLRKYFFKPLT